MKKFMILLLMVLTLSGCDLIKQPDVEDPDDNVTPTIVLNGEAQVRIPLGTTYSDPGVEVSDDAYEVTVIGEVDSSTVGDYTIKYYIVHEGIMIFVERVVTVYQEDVNEVQFYLLGQSTITINVGDFYFEPGYYISDESIVVEASSDVDFMTPGTYHITYTITVDGEQETLVRTIIVDGTTSSYYEFYSDFLNAHTQLYVNVTTHNMSLKYMTLRVEFYRNGILSESYDLVEGDNTFTFDISVEGVQYDLRLIEEYYEDNDYVYEDNIMVTYYQIPSVSAPTISFSNQVVTDSGVSVDFVIVDPDYRFGQVVFTLFNDTLILDSDTQYDVTGTLTFDSLDALTEYKYKATIYYLVNGSDLTVTSDTVEFTTNSNFTYDGYDLSTDTIYVNDTLELVIQVSNPSGFGITDVLMDNASVSYVVNGNTVVVTLDTSTTGTFDLGITSVKYSVNGVVYTCTIGVPITYTVSEEVVTPAAVPELINVESVYDMVNGGGLATYKLYFYNPDQLPITEIYVDGAFVPTNYIFPNEQFTEIQILYALYDSLFPSVIISDFTYVIDGFSVQAEVQSMNTEVANYDTGLAVKNIYNALNLIEFFQQGGGYGKLQADIDFSGQDITDYNGALLNNMIFDGNGHKIYNVLFSGDYVNNTTMVSTGFFGPSLIGAHIYDLELVIYSGTVNSGSGGFTFGGLAGNISDSYIKNVIISGNISLNYQNNGAVGSIAGVSASSHYINVYSSVEIGGQVYSPSSQFAVGGLVGSSTNDVFHQVSYMATLNFYNSFLNDHVYMGGLVGKLQGGTIYEAVRDGQNYLSGEYSGGVVGYMDASSYMYHVYNRKSVSSDGIYTGGLIGFNLGTIENSFAVCGVYGNSTSTGHVYGYNSGTLINVYRDKTQDLYNGLNVIIAVDYNNQALIDILQEDIETVEFYESLGYTNALYQLVYVESGYYSYPPFW